MRKSSSFRAFRFVFRSASVVRVFFSHDRSRKNSISCIDNNFVERRRRRRRQKQQNYLPNKPQTINSTAYGFAKSIFVLPYNNNARSKLSTRRHNGIFRGKNNNLLSIPHAIRRIYNIVWLYGRRRSQGLAGIRGVPYEVQPGEENTISCLFLISIYR